MDALTYEPDTMPTRASTRRASRQGTPAAAPQTEAATLPAPAHQPLTARLAAAGSRRAELEAVLYAAPGLTPPPTLHCLVLEENVTGKGSSASRAKVWRQLRQNYVLDPAVVEYRALVAAMEATTVPSDRGLLLYLMLARTDRIFRELTLASIVPHLAHPGTLIIASNVQSALEGLLQKRQRWTRETLVTVRQHALSALKDFGVLEGGTKKRIARIHPGAQVTLFASRLAHLQRLSPRRIPTSVWFSLLGADEHGAWNLLHQAAVEGVLRVRRQADVVELDLPPLPSAPRTPR